MMKNSNNVNMAKLLREQKGRVTTFSEGQRKNIGMASQTNGI